MTPEQAQKAQRDKIEGRIDPPWEDENGRQWQTASGQPIPLGYKEPAQHGRLESEEDIYRFLLAGNATVTLVSLATSKRYTFRVREGEARGPGCRIWWVDVLKGGDNSNDFGYIGQIREQLFSDHPWYERGKKCWRNYYAASDAFSWFCRQLFEGSDKLDQLEVWHEGKCGRCGRKLTVPESIATGFGPECAGKV